MSAEAAAVDRTLAALADPARRRILDLLRQRPRRAGELAAELAVAPSVMSRHLRVLRESGLVTEHHPDYDARVRIFELRSGAVTDLRAWLDDVERGWADQLAALKRHVEERG